MSTAFVHGHPAFSSSSPSSSWLRIFHVIWIISICIYQCLQSENGEKRSKMLRLNEQHNRFNLLLFFHFIPTFSRPFQRHFLHYFLLFYPLFHLRICLQIYYYSLATASSFLCLSFHRISHNWNNYAQMCLHIILWQAFALNLINPMYNFRLCNDSTMN